MAELGLERGAARHTKGRRRPPPGAGGRESDAEMNKPVAEADSSAGAVEFDTLADFSGSRGRLNSPSTVVEGPLKDELNGQQTTPRRLHKMRGAAPVQRKG